MLPFYGTIGGRRVPRRRDLYEIENIIEKPTPSIAEQELLVPGLRAGHYLCTFGIHVYTPTVMDILTELVREATSNEVVQLTPALAMLAHRERYLALEVQGTRHNIGIRYGLLTAQMALAWTGRIARRFSPSFWNFSPYANKNATKAVIVELANTSCEAPLRGRAARRDKRGKEGSLPLLPRLRVGLPWPMRSLPPQLKTRSFSDPSGLDRG